MKHIATQHIINQYPVSLYLCEPIATCHDEEVYEHGKYYVTCGGEGHYFMKEFEALDAFSTLVNHQQSQVYDMYQIYKLRHSDTLYAIKERKIYKWDVIARQWQRCKGKVRDIKKHCDLIN
ncbi:hypotheticla protein [Erwinia phage vB_EamP-S2]|uniref:Hypotheticla protein n=3 Tax=Eracentumvirus TaxID=2732926 RepID=A0A2K9V4W2_9CAUD|nr:hypotheticla protein [Erwinia phage vB_EamP-S2]AUV57201.1 hypotheticla protein [Erwinia phage vB_EamP-S2]